MFKLHFNVGFDQRPQVERAVEEYLYFFVNDTDQGDVLIYKKFIIIIEVQTCLIQKEFKCTEELQSF